MEKAQNTLVCKYVNSIASSTVYDRQAVHMVVDKNTDCIKKTGIRVNVHKGPLLGFQNLCKIRFSYFSTNTVI